MSARITKTSKLFEQSQSIIRTDTFRATDNLYCQLLSDTILSKIKGVTIAYRAQNCFLEALVVNWKKYKIKNKKDFQCKLPLPVDLLLAFASSLSLFWYLLD